MIHSIYSKEGGDRLSKELDVYYLDKPELTVPTQGYEGDFAYDVYAAEGVLVPPVTFQSAMIPTSLYTAFDETEAGMRFAMRSGTAKKTPLILSNAPAIIEGTYRNQIGVLVRNAFVDNSQVPFAITIDREQVRMDDIPSPIKKAARELWEADMKLLGYEQDLKSPVAKEIFKSTLPRGTVYIPKGARIAQMYFSEKYKVNFKPVNELPESVRGQGGFGSSGTTKEGK
jgi:dUTPase